MKPNTFIKDSDLEDLIYLDNKIVGDYPDMLNIIINSPNIKYNFENFNKTELRAIRMILKNYNRTFKENFRSKNITITTHKVKHKAKKYYYLDAINSYRDPLPFENITNIEFKKIDNRDVILIEGTVSVYGIKNEYGFYNIEQDEFVTIDELEENPNLVVEPLTGPDIFHYVKRRVR